MRKSISLIAISIILFTVGQFLFVPLFGFFEPRIDGITFHIVESNRTIKTSILFSGLLSLTAIFIFIVWWKGQIDLQFRRIASVFTVLVIICIAVIMRHIEVKAYFTRIVRPALLVNGKTSIQYPIDPVNFVYYMFGGLIIGSIGSYFLFREKRNI